MSINVASMIDSAISIRDSAVVTAAAYMFAIPPGGMSVVYAAEPW